jgi:hypothetical protein
MFEKAHDVIVVFLAQDEAEFRMVMVWFIIFRFEDNHNPILEKIIKM